MNKPRGRPPKSEAAKAEERLELRIRHADKTAWQSAAEKAGVSLSAWIRERLNAAAKE